MKVVQINTTCGKGSTGKICVGISELLTEKGIENYILFSLGKTNYPLGIKCSNLFYTKLQALKAKLLGNYGFNSKLETAIIIQQLRRIKPDIVHIHNIHGHDCDFEMLLACLKRQSIETVWTFHDCWAFTGYCPYFDLANCGNWMNQCGDCPQKISFSWFADRSKQLLNKKREALQELDLTIITPSQWLAGLVKESFLKDYPVKVVNNGIDLDTFKPTQGSFREKYGILPEKHIVLGVAFDWGLRKGLDVFVELASKLDSDRYQIVLVGTNDKIDKHLPKNIISIHRTENQKELAEIYTAADVFVNPTREDNYPTVNMEALACGTPVITYETGGSPEMLDKTCGVVVPQNDICELKKEIIRVCETKPFTAEACVKKAREFDKNEKYKQYVELYNKICKER